MDIINTTAQDDTFIIGAELNLWKHVTTIDVNHSNDKLVVVVNGKLSNESGLVIVTISTPQILHQMEGSIAQVIGDQKVFGECYPLKDHYSS